MSDIRMMMGQRTTSRGAFGFPRSGERSAAGPTAGSTLGASRAAGDEKVHPENEDAGATPSEVFSQLLAISQTHSETRQQVSWAAGREALPPSVFPAGRATEVRSEHRPARGVRNFSEPTRESRVADRSVASPRSEFIGRGRAMQTAATRTRDSHATADTRAGADESVRRVQTKVPDSAPDETPTARRADRGSPAAARESAAAPGQESEGAKTSRVDARGGDQSFTESTHGRTATRPAGVAGIGEGISVIEDPAAGRSKEIGKEQPLVIGKTEPEDAAEVQLRKASGTSSLSRQVEESTAGSFRQSGTVVSNLPGEGRRSGSGQKSARDAARNQAVLPVVPPNGETSNGEMSRRPITAAALEPVGVGANDGNGAKPADLLAAGRTADGQVANSHADVEALLQGPEGDSVDEMEGTRKPTTKQGVAEGKEFGFRMHLRSQNPANGQPGSNAAHGEARSGWSARAIGTTGGIAPPDSNAVSADPLREAAEAAEAQRQTSGGGRGAEQGNIARQETTAGHASAMARSAVAGAAIEAARQAATEGQQQAKRFSGQSAARRLVFSMAEAGKQVANAAGLGHAAVGKGSVSGSSTGSMRSGNPAAGTGLAPVPTVAGSAPAASANAGNGEAAQAIFAEGSGGSAGSINSPATGRVAAAGGNVSLEAQLAAKEAFSMASARSILVKLPAALRGEAVNLRFLQRGDALDIRIASPSAEAAQQLRGEIPTLLSRLQQTGLQPEAITDLDATRQNQDGGLRRSTQEDDAAHLREHAADDQRGLADEGREQRDEETELADDTSRSGRNARGRSSSGRLLFEQFINREAHPAVASGNLTMRDGARTDEIERMRT